MSSSRLHTSNGSPLREYQARIINGVDDGDDMSLYVMPHDSLGLSQKIYESPRSASGSVRDLKSLMEVTSRAGRDYSCSCVVVNGTSGYATFLNGTYQRIEDVFYHNRPVYRRDTRVPYGNTAAVAKHLYIYYKKKQSAWVVGLRVGASGVLAQCPSTSHEPCGNDSTWHVTDIQGKFHEDVTVSVSAAEGLTCAARKSDLLSVASFAPSGTLPTSWSRHKTAKFLREKFADKCASEGDFVVRQSTSIPDVLIMSILKVDGSVEHLRVDFFKDQYFVGKRSASTWYELISSLAEKPAHVSSGPLPKLRNMITVDDSHTTQVSATVTKYEHNI